MMEWTTFDCTDPDFYVRSTSDDVQFGVKRACLEESEVFRDMFSCCEAIPDENEEKIIEVTESAGELAALLQLLHSRTAPPKPLSPLDGLSAFSQSFITYDGSSVIPFPLIPLLFKLADKYALSEKTLSLLRLHLLAHASTEPLKTYGFATVHGMDDVAIEASRHLVHPTLSSYTLQEIKVIPTVEAYHKLVLLHAFRAKRLREVLVGEEIFPHDYRICTSHGKQTRLRWCQTQKDLVDRVEAGTDVAAEMSTLLEEFRHCKTCLEGCTAAIDMMAYKCRKIPRQIDEIPL